jgi:type III pantothenate kinase
MTVLLIDVGNTRVKWGFLRDARLAECGSRAHRGRADVAAAAVAKAIRGERVKFAAIANVAGAGFETRLTETLTNRFQVKVRVATVGRRKLGVRCGYRDPKRLGVDRWLSVLAAHALSAAGAVVVDVGTTVTVDGVTAQGEHLGGLIIPSPRLMATTLGQRTSDIGDVAVVPATLLQRHHEFLGRSTAEAVNMGSWFALIGAVEEVLQRLAQTLPPSAPVLVTGGDAPSLLPGLRIKAELREHLVLEGLALFVGQRVDFVATEGDR